MTKSPLVLGTKVIPKFPVAAVDDPTPVLLSVRRSPATTLTVSEVSDNTPESVALNVMAMAVSTLFFRTVNVRLLLVPGVADRRKYRFFKVPAAGITT